MSKKIIINGKELELDGVSTVSELLEARNVTGTMFVIEKNLEIVNKEVYSSTEVNEGDSFEIVGFFGGG